MSKKLTIILVVALALVAASSVFADHAVERNEPPAQKDQELSKDAPGPAGNPYLGSPGSLKGPLSEGFEDGAIPANWTVRDVDGDSKRWEASDYANHSGIYGASVGWNASGCDDWLITPRLVCGPSDTLKFWARSSGSYYHEDFEVWVSTTDTAIASFTDMVYDSLQIPNAWEEHRIPLDTYASDSIYVAVRCISVDQLALHVDDFSGPELWAPAGPAIGFNTTSLVFGMVTVGDSATLPLVIYSTGGSNLTVDDVVSDNVHFTEDFTGPQTIPSGDSLVVDVTFKPTAEPEEIGQLTVTHDGAKAESLIDLSGSGFAGLFIEKFSGAFPPAGWACYELGDPLSPGWQQGTQGYDDSYCAYHNDDNVQDPGSDDWLVTPPIDLPVKAFYELEFMQYENYSPYYVYHGIMISTGSGDPFDGEFVELLEVGAGTEDTWEAVEDISLASYAGETIYLAFRYMGDYADQWSVDNVVIQEYVYVNEPPQITHDPKGDTDDTTPTITAIITDIEAVTASVFYETATKVFSEAAMSLTGVLPNEYSVDLPVQPYGTINYYIQAEDVSKGLISTDPPGAPAEYYSFEVQPLVGLELVYDDGTVENATCWVAGYEDNRFAVRFTPPAYPCTLTAVKLGIAGDWPDDAHQPFLIEVYDDDGSGGLPGTMIYGPDNTGSIGNVVGGVPAYPALNWAYVCIDPPVVITDGDFYVAKGQTTVNPECEGLEMDQEGTQYSRSYQYSYSTDTWSEYYPGERNLMIRAYTSQVVTYGNIAGTVGEAKGPIVGAIVTADGATVTLSDTTNAAGEYLIENLPTGLYDVTASATGYYSRTEEDVVVTEGGTTVVNFSLTLFGSGDVLLVDADGSSYEPDYFADVRSYFTDALDVCGYTYDIHEKMVYGGDGPDYAAMQDFEVVIWFTGEAWHHDQTLTATDETNLGLYLDGGGNLFLSAMDYFYDRYPGNDPGSFSPGQFPYDYLGVTWTDQDKCSFEYPEKGRAAGYAGSVADGLSYDLWDVYTTVKGGGKGPDDGLYIDELQILGDAVFEVLIPDSVTIAACQYEGAGFKSVFTTVDFAGLIDETPSTRAELMCSIMNWFLGGVPVELASFAATAGDQMVSLTWETRSELENLGFEIYRRVDGQDFVKVNAERISGAGSSEDVHSYTYVDRGLVNGVTYYYQVAAVDFGGNVEMHDALVSATPTAVLPTAFVLSQNYPNPFNPNTEIKYQIPEDSRVVLKIYNVRGQEVVSLMDADLQAGYYTATWNARDSRGVEVSAGIYFCTMQADQFSQTMKMVLIR